MKRIINLTLVLLFIALNQVCLAQQRILSGSITDMNGEPLAGATVVLLPSNLGTITSKQGYFNLYAEISDKNLVVSLLNYKQATIRIGTNPVFKIALSSSVVALNEVISVGTRNPGRTRLNSPVPVDVFNINRLQVIVPQNDLNQLLQYASPSFNSTRQSSSDGTEHIDPASCSCWLMEKDGILLHW